MIVSFDGNVFVGKTHLINNIASTSSCFNKILEYSFFLNKIKNNNIYNHYANEQLKYVMVDALRQKNLKTGINLVDRSFVSMSAHVYALFYINSTDIRSLYVKKLKSCLEREKIIIPDKFIYVTCSYNTAKTRFAKEWFKKNTGEIYINKKYFAAIEKFNCLWAQYASSLVIKSGQNQKALNFILKKEQRRKTKLSGKEIWLLTSKILGIKK